MAVDRERAQKAVVELLTALGENPQRPELIDTPARVADALTALVTGIDVDPAALITFLNEAPSGNDPVILTNVAVRSLCEHHLLPFAGVAHVAYVPGERLVTLGSLTRLVEIRAAKPQVQERLGAEIADALITAIGAQGGLVVLDMTHECLGTHSSGQNESRTLTITSRGCLDDAASRTEIISLIGEAK